MNQTPAVSGKQLVKILEGQGWSVKRVRGSHHIMRHPTVPDAIPVPSTATRRSCAVDYLGDRRDAPRGMIQLTGMT